ncbi:MAG TPA: hypothetical protein VKY90_21890 [Candidatus Dormibacteraeota bacterium]|nr:hypothetical protein [Candidatus Dormibacteraeota bacterium]
MVQQPIGRLRPEEYKYCLCAGAVDLERMVWVGCARCGVIAGDFGLARESWIRATTR